MPLTVGDKVRLAREAQSPPWSQYDLAKQAGIARGRIAMWEANKTKHPKREDIQVVADVLAVPIDWFYDPHTTKVPAQKQTATARIVTAPGIVEGFALLAALRCYRGALAGHASDEAYFELDGMIEVPTAFLVGGADRIDLHDVVVVAGRSLEPRVSSGDRVIIYRDTTLYRNSIVLATSPDGAVFLKVLREGPARNGALGYELHSLSPHGSTFTDIAGWTIHGYSVAIIKDDDSPGPNVEWRSGRAIRA